MICFQDVSSLCSSLLPSSQRFFRDIFVPCFIFSFSFLACFFLSPSATSSHPTTIDLSTVALLCMEQRRTQGFPSTPPPRFHSVPLRLYQLSPPHLAKSNQIDYPRVMFSWVCEEMRVRSRNLPYSSVKLSLGRAPRTKGRGIELPPALPQELARCRCARGAGRRARGTAAVGRCHWPHTVVWSTPEASAGQPERRPRGPAGRAARHCRSDRYGTRTGRAAGRSPQPREGPAERDSENQALSYPAHCCQSPGKLS